MVNTGDIFQAEEAEQAAKNNGDAALDDVMLAMDVVDTARHEDRLLNDDLAGDERQRVLLERLRTIYDAQGIEVSDKVLLDGVLALETQRFEYKAPKKSLGLSVAKLYINRARWLPLFSIFLTVILGAWLVNHYAFERPAQLEAQRIEKLFSETFPNQIDAQRDTGLAAAATDDIKTRINELHALAASAIAEKDIKKAREYSEDLSELSEDISQSYSLRIVNRRNEMSGVFRLNDDNNNVRNYYLIVEAINAAGEPVKVTINSEEDNQTRQTSIWGLRVPDQVFQSVADDKRDDMIIQNNIVGQKRRGYLEPEYSIETSGGKILEW